MIMRKRPEPEQIFVDGIKTMIKNLLIENKNYDGEMYFPKDGSCKTYNLISGTKERSEYIISMIESWEHLVIDKE